MRSSSSARPATPATRTLLSTGLTGLLVPLCLAVPALTGTAAAAPSTAVPSAALPAAAPVATTALRLSAPRGAVAPGAQRIGVRLLADGRFVPGATVEVQRRSGSTWVAAASARTDGAGHAVVTLPVKSTTAVRAVFAGSATAAAGAAPAATVTVRPAAAALRVGSSFRAQAVRIAAAQAGKPYRWGSAGPSSFDCSGLINFAFRAVGKSLPRTSSQLRRATRPVSKAAAQPGDLIFIPGHVGIYAGNGKMIDAPSAGRKVSLRRIYTSRYTVGRVV